MSIDAIRYRVEGALCVLQVQKRTAKQYRDYTESDTVVWRDAKVEDMLEVARYTRKFDALVKLISGFQTQLLTAQDQCQAVMDKNFELLTKGKS